MKSILIAALLVLEGGATEKKHHHKSHLPSRGVSFAELQAKKGMTKEFFEHRNMLNERENMNVQMYDDLNDKLSDEQYIG